MTVVKPKANHPWHEKIKNDVDRAKLRQRIEGIRQRIADLKSELKELEGRLSNDARVRSKN